MCLFFIFRHSCVLFHFWIVYHLSSAFIFIFSPIVYLIFSHKLFSPYLLVLLSCRCQTFFFDFIQFIFLFFYFFQICYQIQEIRRKRNLSQNTNVNVNGRVNCNIVPQLRHNSISKCKSRIEIGIKKSKTEKDFLVRCVCDRNQWCLLLT